MEHSGFGMLGFLFFIEGYEMFQYFDIVPLVLVDFDKHQSVTQCFWYLEVHIDDFISSESHIKNIIMILVLIALVF
jgi:hypothetical protein